MLFNSVDFLLFLPCVLLLYQLLPRERRWYILLFSGYVFYAGWKVAYLGLILFSTVVDYVLAQWIYASENQRKRSIILGLSLFSNFSLLIAFKYFHFLIGGAAWFKNLEATTTTVSWLNFIFTYGIPVGISFYTFQTVSYTIDVYRRRCIPERNFFKFALFVNFFPQLVAGPIERFSNLHPQLFKGDSITWQRVRTAFHFLLHGFFLKLAIADPMGAFASPVFSEPDSYAWYFRIAAVLAFGIQIYADFNAYSTIAVGTAKLFNIQLMQNFSFPYSATSIKSFWSKWHISLSTWFRDYVYIPLGGSQHSKWKWIVAITFTFGLSGLWHGANVTFIYWGLLHAFFYLLEARFYPERKDTNVVERILRWTITMSVVFFGWLLFRADTMKIVTLFFSECNTTQLPFPWEIVFYVTTFIACDYWIGTSTFSKRLSSYPLLLRWGIYCAFITLICLGSVSEQLQFIYFQF